MMMVISIIIIIVIHYTVVLFLSFLALNILTNVFELPLYYNF